MQNIQKQLQLHLPLYICLQSFFLVVLFWISMLEMFDIKQPDAEYSTSSHSPFVLSFLWPTLASKLVHSLSTTLKAVCGMNNSLFSGGPSHDLSSYCTLVGTNIDTCSPFILTFIKTVCASFLIMQFPATDTFWDAVIFHDVIIIIWVSGIPSFLWTILLKFFCGKFLLPFPQLLASNFSSQTKLLIMKHTKLKKSQVLTMKTINSFTLQMIWIQRLFTFQYKKSMSCKKDTFMRLTSFIKWFTMTLQTQLPTIYSISINIAIYAWPTSLHMFVTNIWKRQSW